MNHLEMSLLHKRLSDELKAKLFLKRGDSVSEAKIAQLRHALAFWRRLLVAPVWSGTLAAAQRGLTFAKARHKLALWRARDKNSGTSAWRREQNLTFARYMLDCWSERVRSAKQAEPTKPTTKHASYAARAAVREIKRKRKAAKALLDQSRARV